MKNHYVAILSSALIAHCLTKLLQAYWSFTVVITIAMCEMIFLQSLFLIVMRRIVKKTVTLLFPSHDYGIVLMNFE